ncbi:MAG: MBL fold metallo-hydrolase [Dehalococcoidia bacterium]
MITAERVYADSDLVIDALKGLGPMGNNAYLLRPADGGPVVVVDAPEGSEAVVSALGDAEVGGVILTHSHRDHWAGHEVLRARVTVPFSAARGQPRPGGYAARSPPR